MAGGGGRRVCIASGGRWRAFTVLNASGVVDVRNRGVRTMLAAALRGRIALFQSNVMVTSHMNVRSVQG